eukprot:gb/GEZN01011744.1/.p1 GENE.gb/GEZN01011744.1/~~gb/GEZN01011744.1/.p1  ORF type:complete len:152 (+),score=20.67 gb/GEZN01011744.1/:244-699(+)
MASPSDTPKTNRPVTASQKAGVFSNDAPIHISNPSADLKSSDQDFKHFYKRTHISGLGQQRQRFDLIQLRIAEMREIQQELFLDQFEDFPETTGSRSSFSQVAIQKAFQPQDAAAEAGRLNSLSNKMTLLSQKVDAINKLAINRAEITPAY